MTRVTVTLDRSEALALIRSSDFADNAFDALGVLSSSPAGTSPREIAVQKLTAALERAELSTDGFEALGIEPNPHVQRTWRP